MRIVQDIDKRMDELEVIIDRLLEEQPEDLTELQKYTIEYAELVKQLTKRVMSEL